MAFDLCWLPQQMRAASCERVTQRAASLEQRAASDSHSVSQSRRLDAKNVGIISATHILGNIARQPRRLEQQSYLCRDRFAASAAIAAICHRRLCLPPVLAKLSRGCWCTWTSATHRAPLTPSPHIDRAKLPSCAHSLDARTQISLRRRRDARDTAAAPWAKRASPCSCAS